MEYETKQNLKTLIQIMQEMKNKGTKNRRGQIENK